MARGSDIEGYIFGWIYWVRLGKVGLSTAGVEKIVSNYAILNFSGPKVTLLSIDGY